MEEQDAQRRALRDLQQSTPLRVLRVTQLDADQLDGDLAGMFGAEVKGIFKWWQPSFLDRFRDEIQAAIRLGMCALSLWQDGATHGLAIMSLKYRDERAHWRNTVGTDAPITLTQKSLWTLGHVGIPYLLARLSSSESRDTDDTSLSSRLRRLAARLESIYAVISLLNLAVFLVNGRYRSPLDRLLCMRLVYSRRHMSRHVSFDFLNRQLVWHAFTEFVLFVAPLVSASRVRAAAAAVRVKLGIGAAGKKIEKESENCPFCEAAEMMMAVKMEPCGHRACYYCAAAQYKAAGGQHVDMHCPRCAEVVKGVERYGK